MDMTVRFDNVDVISRVEYTWVHIVDIEKRIPMTVTLTEPRFDGSFRIPIGSAAIPTMGYIVLRAVYRHGGDGYGLVTTKHFSDTYTDTRGHKVNMISVLSRAPLAWVKMNTHAAESYPFTGDAVCGHQPEMVVQRIYTFINRHMYNFMFTLCTPESTVETDTMVSELVSETLSPLRAPGQLAHKPAGV